MNRIFAIISIIANLTLLAALILGWQIGDGQSLAPVIRGKIDLHMLVALAAATLSLLVHAVVLTYFMGTGRWIEETSTAYSLGEDRRRSNISIKYQVIPGMVTCILLIIATGAFGALSDRASRTNWEFAPSIHFVLALITLATNLIVSYLEYSAIRKNGLLVDEVIASVRRIRVEKGLDPA